MNPVEQIEEVMGKPYGVPPMHVHNSYLNRYLFYLASNGLTFSNIFKNAPVYADIYSDRSGFYESEFHTVFSKKSRRRTDKFTELHEYTHGYTSQRNGNIGKENLLERLTIVMTGTPEEFEAMVIRLSLDEGIADYTSIQAQRLEKSRGRNPKELYFYRRDAFLMQYITEITPQHDKKMDLMGFSRGHINLLSDLGKVSMKLQKAAINKDISTFTKDEKEMMDISKYLIGYIAARAIFNDEMTGIGDKVDALVTAPPKTFKELEELAFYS